MISKFGVPYRITPAGNAVAITSKGNGVIMNALEQPRTGYIQTETVNPATYIQLVALRDLLLSYKDTNAAAAVDNVIDILSQKAGEVVQSGGRAHVFHKCSNDDCYVCNAGLSLCTICGQAEGELEKFCKGQSVGLHPDDEADIKAQQAELRNQL